MLTLNFSPFPTLTTARLSLREVTPADVNEIFFLRSDKRVMEFIDKAPAQTLQEAADWMLKVKETENKNETVTWAICMKGESKLIGTICYWNIRKEHYRAEIGYALHPDFQLKGIMQEALDAVIKYGFNKMKLHSIEANVNPNNKTSIKLLERNNFVREGYFKENYYFDGNFLDSAIYSLLAPLK